MSRDHRFGGQWTAEKLERVRKYLEAYTKIFTVNERAKHLRTMYVDAFAGSGHRVPSTGTGPGTLPLPTSQPDPEALEYQKGSAAIALEVEPGFDSYLFIETDPTRAAGLEGLRDSHLDKAPRISIARDDANLVLGRFAQETDWRRNRAVVFLDPYGMAVDWATIQALGGTHGVDLWILFPLGQAVNRLLMRREIPTDGWADALTRCFGTDEWRSEFYEPSAQMNWIDAEPGVEKIATFSTIAVFFQKRLGTCFSRVADNSLRLCNSRNTPLFLLCFASANEKGAPTAIRIANDLLREG